MGEVVYYAILGTFFCLSIIVIVYFRHELRAIGRRLYLATRIRLCWRRFKYKFCSCLLRPGQDLEEIEKEIQEAEARKRIGFEIVNDDQILDR